MAQWIDYNFKKISLALWGILWIIYFAFMIFMFISLPTTSMLVVLGVLDIPYLFLVTIMLILIASELKDEAHDNKKITIALAAPYIIVWIITIICLGWLLMGSL